MAVFKVSASYGNGVMFLNQGCDFTAVSTSEFEGSCVVQKKHLEFIRNF
ncbi:hypothetical protein SLEP1_g37720 [Rubroshorea leprosula]|uniref:Uncharacterized protein n=1 Tax=Rubroshorea leprosula TaxID=152421 RepID=A0AAV5KWE7_9ROSI|nr:hypothetical protein SLEP1_g37720 [Rubroshorea leprosula]